VQRAVISRSIGLLLSVWAAIRLLTDRRLYGGDADFQTIPMKAMINVITPTQGSWDRRKFLRRHQRVEDFLWRWSRRCQFRNGCGKWTNMGAGRPYVPDNRLNDPDAQRGVIGRGVARMLVCANRFTCPTARLPAQTRETGRRRRSIRAGGSCARRTRGPASSGRHRG